MTDSNDVANEAELAAKQSARAADAAEKAAAAAMQSAAASQQSAAAADRANRKATFLLIIAVIALFISFAAFLNPLLK
jgi:hypothetical protein